MNETIKTNFMAVLVYHAFAVGVIVGHMTSVFFFFLRERLVLDMRGLLNQFCSFDISLGTKTLVVLLSSDFFTSSTSKTVVLIVIKYRICQLSKKEKYI